MELVFTKPKKYNVFAWLIRKVMSTKYSHVAMRYWDADSQSYMIYHAGVKGVEPLSEDRFTEKNSIIFSKKFDLTIPKKTEVIRFCHKSLNIQYGFLTIIGLLFKKAFGVTSKLGKDGSHSYICSEFAAKLLVIMRPSLADKITDDITPKELYALVRSI